MNLKENMKFALVILLVAVTSASVEHYHDYSVFRLRPSNETQLQLIQQLEDQDVRHLTELTCHILLI